jgi:hypothetical protein
MYKEVHDDNSDRMRALAKTIKGTTSTRYHVTDMSMPRHPASKAGLFLKNFFPQREMNVAALSTEDLINDLAGGQPGTGVARFKDTLQALYPGFPELWDMKPPMAGNMVMRPVDPGDTNWPSESVAGKAASALARNQAAKSLQKAVASGGDAEAELAKYRETIFRLMPERVREIYLASA